MNDTSSSNEPRPEPYDRHEARQQRREARRASLDAPSGGGALVMGLILIVLGVAFLMQNFGTFVIPLANWWALFILIPAVGAFDKAYRIYRQEGNLLTAAVRGPLLIGMVLTAVTVTFLFQLSWAYIGPVIIILVGVGMLLTPKR